MPCLIHNRSSTTMFNAEHFTADVLRCDLINRKPLLLLDCRPQTDFSQSHIAGAINITLPNLMLKRLKRGTLNIACVIQSNEAKEKFTKCSLSHTVLLYDQYSCDLTTNPSCVLCLLYKKLKEDGSVVSFLVGGFASFQAHYPDLCIDQEEEDSTILGLRNLKITDDSSSIINDNSRTPPQLSPFPVKVLPFLYLGNAKNSADLSLLRTYGIRYILNVTPNVPNQFECDDSFKYMQIPINDHWSQNLSVFFAEAINFIDEARKNNSAVLVHCLAGVSRSVTVTVAYLMQEQRMSLNEAYDFVKLCKPNISPNFNFMGQLLEFEQFLGFSSSNLSNCHPAVGFSSPRFPEFSPSSDTDCGTRSTRSLDHDLLSDCRGTGLEAMVLSSSSASSEASPNYRSVTL